MIVVLGFLAWVLLSVPLAVVVGRGIAEADRRASRSVAVSPGARRSIAS